MKLPGFKKIKGGNIQNIQLVNILVFHCKYIIVHHCKWFVVYALSGILLAVKNVGNDGLEVYLTTWRNIHELMMWKNQNRKLNEHCVSKLIHSVFIKCLLCAKHYFGQWGKNIQGSEKSKYKNHKVGMCLVGTTGRRPASEGMCPSRGWGQWRGERM